MWYTTSSRVRQAPCFVLSNCAVHGSTPDGMKERVETTMAEAESKTEPLPPVVDARADDTHPTSYAIIATGGKQYRVAVGDRLSIEKLPVDAGEEVTFDQVLMLGGDKVQIGAPLVAGATVSGRIEEQYRGEKIIVFKYKPKKRYRRRQGHRQSLTRVAITAINA